MNNDNSYPLGFKIFVAIVIAIVALCIYQSDFSPSLIIIVSIVFATIAFIIFLIYRLPMKERGNTLEQIDEDAPSCNSVILVQNMSKDEIIDVIESFNKMSEENDDEHEDYIPEIESSNNDFLLIFDRNINFKSFCFWVNYFVYSDRNKRHNTDITGWYAVGNTNNNHPLANNVLMLFIPESDNEFDNVYFVDRFNNCYKQEFEEDMTIIPLKESFIRYKDMPPTN